MDFAAQLREHTDSDKERFDKIEERLDSIEKKLDEFMKRIEPYLQAVGGLGLLYKFALGVGGLAGAVITVWALLRGKL